MIRSTVLVLALAGVIASDAVGLTPTVQSGNDYYRVVIADPGVPSGAEIAGYPAAFTGPGNPITTWLGGPAEIIGLHRDCGFCPGWNDFGLATFRSWASHTDYLLGANDNYLALADAGFACVDQNEVELPIVEVLPSGGVPGVRATWRIENGSDSFLVTREMRVHGTDVIDSRIEMTIRVLNTGPVTSVVGVRDGLAVRISGPVTASFPHGFTISTPRSGVHPPDPVREPLMSTEIEWSRPAFRMLQLSAGPTPSRDDSYSVACAIAGPPSLDPRPTTPDVLQHVPLNPFPTIGPPDGGAADRCFEWHPPTPARGVAQNMVLVSYWGLDEARAIALEPGEEARFTQYLVAFEEYPLSSEAGDPVEVDCDGERTTVSLAGEARTIVPTVGQIFYRWSSADPRVSFSDRDSPTTEATIVGVGAFDVTLTVAVGAFEASDTTTVTVVDAQPPTFRRLEVTPSRLWPPNHEMWPVDVPVDFADDCDPAPALRLAAVTSSDPDDVRRGGDGNTTDDIGEADLGTDDRHVLLRAERQGRGEGRIYTLTYEAVDWAGNVASRSVEVSVQHDQRSGRSRSPRRP
jgi:hypothetical protein